MIFLSCNTEIRGVSCNIVFTGRSRDKVDEYGSVDEKSVKTLFEFLDEKGIFAETPVLNAADQGLGLMRALALDLAAHARNTTGAELVVDGGNSIRLYPIIPKG